jgi:O-antigen ligase/Tfp pilus assembly protein PilF
MNNYSYRLFLFAIVFSPLAFGAVETWSLFLMESAVLIAICIFLFDCLGKKKPLFEIPGLVPLVALLAYMVFQLLPLPPALIKILSPGTYNLYSDSVWLSEPAKWLSLSINRKAGLSEFFRFYSYACIYILSIQLLAKSGLFRKTVLIIAGFGALLAFFAILQHLVPNNKIYWIRELTQGGTPFGPYVNRNHFAGLMGMIFPLIVSLFIYYLPKFKDLSLRGKIAALFTTPKSNTSVLLGLSAVLTATAIFLSLSRGGIASLVMSVVFLGLLLAKRPGRKRRGLVVVSVIIVTLYTVGWFGWGPVFQRFQNIRNFQGEISDLRLDIWKDSLNIVRDFPLTGTGFGSYVSIYPAYKTIDNEGIATHAHNDYLELLTNGGVIFAFLLVWFCFAVLRRSYSVFRARRDPFSIALFSGSLAGIFSILLHGITDFNLQIGANGLYFFLLMGLAVSASHTRFQEEKGTILRRLPTLRFNRLAGFASAALLLLALVFYSGRLFGAFLYSGVSERPLNRAASAENLMTAGESLARASFFDPLEPEYHFMRARAEAVALNIPEALRNYRTAVALDPANSIYLRSLGLFLQTINGQDEAAGALLRAGAVRDRKNLDAHVRYGAFLIDQGRRDEGIEVFRTAGLVAPARIRESITAMVLVGLTDREIMAALPGQTGPYVTFANYLEKTGNDALASEVYTTALSLPSGKGQNPATPYNAAFSFHMGKQDFPGAAAVMQKAVETFPEEIGMKLKLAEAYERQKLIDKALEQYRAVLKSDTKNARAEKKIRQLE